MDPIRGVSLVALVAATLFGGSADAGVDYEPYDIYQGRFYQRLGAECLERAGPNPRCVQLLESSISFDPTNPSVHLVLGRFYGAAGLLDRARGAFARAMELAPEAMAPRLGLAEVYIAEEKFNEARKLYQGWLDTHPKDGFSAYQLAALEAAQLEEDAAIQELKEAIALGFRDPAVVRQDPRWRGVLGSPALEAILMDLEAKGL